MKCCDTTECEQGKYCPERVARVPIELQQLPGRQTRRTMRAALLLATVIVVSILGAIGLIAKGVGA